MQAARESRVDPAPIRNLSSAYYESGQYEMCLLFAKKAIHLMNKAVTGDQDSAFTTYPIQKQKERRVEILDRLARYHGSMRSAGDYVPIGHDNAKSLFDESLALQVPAGETISFFNSGLGDARHFLASLISIAHDEGKGKIPKRRYHFTLNDINRHVLTRALIIFSLLDKLSRVKEGQMFELLQEIIAELLRRMRNGQRPLEWIYLSEADVASCIQALENWVSAGRVATLFTAKEVMESTMSTMDDSIYSNKSDEYWAHIGFHSNKEKELYCATGVLLQCLQAMQRHDPKLADLSLKALHNPRGRESRLFMAHVMTDNWAFNPTQLNWDSHTDIGNGEPRVFLRFDPFNLVSRLLKVEMVKGDYIDVAERIHFGLHYDPTQSQALDTGDIGYPRPKDFPSIYHRMTLSYVPDYVGGHLTTFLHAMPLLASYTYYCWNQPDESVPLSKQMKARLSREDLARWFHGLFLKMATPMTSDHRLITGNNHMIYSPLNLTIFFRQLDHLHCLGYPAHWLSGVLIPLLEDVGMLKTDVRPPSNVPLRPDQIDLKIENTATLFAPFLPFCIDSYILYSINKIHEYTIDLSPLQGGYFQPTCLVLLFWSRNGSPSGHLPPELYPSLRPFLDPSRRNGPADHGSEDAAQKIEDWKAKEVIVWSTLKFDIEKQEAKAWMPKQMIEQMVNRKWKCGLMRRNLWMVVGATIYSTSGRVRDMVKMGRRWDEVFREDDDTEKGDDGSNDEDALQGSVPNPMDHRMFHVLVEEIFNGSKKLGAANENTIDGGGAMDKKNKGEDDVDDEYDEYDEEPSLD
ncbi:hypothetical protein EAF00_005509 [Botryotinia globosa]|nr:hypothetical protein EAF00_005509 [Botryotinia globosa]